MALKTIDMTRTIRDRHFEETREMTKEEYLAYLQTKSASIRNPLETLGEKPAKRRCQKRLSKLL